MHSVQNLDKYADFCLRTWHDKLPFPRQAIKVVGSLATSNWVQRSREQLKVEGVKCPQKIQLSACWERCLCIIGSSPYWHTKIIRRPGCKHLYLQVAVSHSFWFHVHRGWIHSRVPNSIHLIVTLPSTHCHHLHMPDTEIFQLRIAPVASQGRQL